MRDHYFILFLTAMLVMGCQTQTDVSQNENKKWEEETTVSEEVKEERANLTNVNHASTAPHQVCRGFLELLQLDKTSEAQNLLTRKALALTLRFDLPLGFPGDADATFTVEEAKFATKKRKMAQVNCTINEKESGQDVSSKLAWMLKRENNGWRICGMMIPSADGEPMEFLSFESVGDVDLIKRLVSGAPATDQLQAMIQSSFTKY